MKSYQVSDKRYKQIIDIVRNVTDKLKNPNEVKRICREESNYLIIEGKKVDPWDDLGLINGYPAVSVFFGELMNAFPDEDWEVILILECPME